MGARSKRTRRCSVAITLVSLFALMALFACDNTDQPDTKQTKELELQSDDVYGLSTEEGKRKTADTEMIKTSLPQVDFSKALGASEHTCIWHVIDALEHLEIGNIIEVKSEPYDLEYTDDEVLKITLIDDKDKKFELVVDYEFYPYGVLRYDSPNDFVFYPITIPIE